MIDVTAHEKVAAVLDMPRYLMDGAEVASHPASQDELFFQTLHQFAAVSNYLSGGGYAVHAAISVR